MRCENLTNRTEPVFKSFVSFVDFLSILVSKNKPIRCRESNQHASIHPRVLWWVILISRHMLSTMKRRRTYGRGPFTPARCEPPSVVRRSNAFSQVNISNTINKPHATSTERSIVIVVDDHHHQRRFRHRAAYFGANRLKWSESLWNRTHLHVNTPHQTMLCIVGDGDDSKFFQMHNESQAGDPMWVELNFCARTFIARQYHHFRRCSPCLRTSLVPSSASQTMRAGVSVWRETRYQVVCLNPVRFILISIDAHLLNQPPGDWMIRILLSTR